MTYCRCDITKEIDMAKKKIYNEIIINKEETVYDLQRFREFCFSAGAAKLFDTILGSSTYKLPAFSRPHMS